MSLNLRKTPDTQGKRSQILRCLSKLQKMRNILSADIRPCVDLEEITNFHLYHFKRIERSKQIKGQNLRFPCFLIQADGERNITVQDMPENSGPDHTNFDIGEWKFITQSLNLKNILVKPAKKEGNSTHQLMKIR